MAEIKLDSKQVRFSEPLPTRPEELVLMKGIAPLLRERLVEAIMAPHFHRAQVEADLERLVIEAPQSILQDLVQAEARSVYDSKPLTQRVRETVGDDLANAALPISFLREIGQELRSSFSVLDEIEKFHSKDIGQAITALIRDIVPYVTEMRKGGKIDPLYNYVLSRESDPALVVSPNELEVFHILLYLPSTLRYPIQDLLIQRSCIEQLRTQTSKWDGKAEEYCVALITERLQKQIYCNRHWTNLMESYGASSELTLTLGRHELDLLSGIKVLRDQIPMSVLGRVNGEFVRIYSLIENKMRDVERASSTRLWNRTDVGHCFSRDDFSLDVISKGGRPFHFAVKKCGFYAVVLEDDTHQRERWCKAVGEHSVYSLLPNGEGQCADIESVSQWLGDPRVGLYLLDIENGDNRGAGILVAQNLLDTLGKADLAKFPNKIVIVVWSASHELVKSAKRELSDFVEQQGYKDTVSFGSISRQIEVKILAKSDLPFFPYLK